MSLRSAPPRPTAARVSPAYPRVIAVGALLLAGCGGVVQGSENQSASPATPATTSDATPPSFPEPAGTAPAIYDSGAPETQPPPTPDADPAGDIAYPYDADSIDVQPPPPPPPPVLDDAGAETDPQSAGGAPAPFDAGAPEPQPPSAGS